jgi:hypothetical protein
LISAVPASLASTFQPRGATPQEIETLTAERQVVERELSNLVEFVIKGVLSSSGAPNTVHHHG